MTFDGYTPPFPASPSQWWSEELWRYDAEADCVNIRYPVSSYNEDHFSVLDMEEAEGELREAIWNMGDACGEPRVASMTAEDLA